MSTDRTHRVNIALMLGSAAAAAVAPYELLLASYAILGPLHYLTEIHWLHRRRYFLPDAVHAHLLLGLSVLCVFLIKLGLNYSGPTGFVLVASFILLTSTRWKTKALALACAALVVALLDRRPWQPLSILLILLPAAVHVFVFTGAFILLGALKTKSRAGLLSFATLLACATVLASGDFRALDHPISAYVSKNYAFDSLNRLLAQILRVPFQPGPVVDPALHGFARFLAFAYTYHYLNWFSKVSVFKWHHIDRRALYPVAGIYLLSLGAYLWDYRAGFALSFYLSFGHVLLEFPLNCRSFKDIGREIGGRLAGIAHAKPAEAIPATLESARSYLQDS